MSLWEQLLLILGMAAVTYIPRVAPLLALASRSPHPGLLRFLEMIPPAVLAALLAPELLLRNTAQVSELFLSLDNTFLLAAVPTVAVGLIRRDFFGTVAVGMLAVALIRLAQDPPLLMSVKYAWAPAVLAAILVGLWRRNFFAALGVGIGTFALLRLIV